eukprot:479421-Amorphochlora_amoeboformis.AAC.2
MTPFTKIVARCPSVNRRKEPCARNPRRNPLVANWYGCIGNGIRPREVASDGGLRHVKRFKQENSRNK